uniref:hypothetical protein n=1 Tax=Candidatus Electronema sp. TaxID=2698783 RepID=UPI004056444A
MDRIQWRPETNALTTPVSYRPRFVPSKVSGIDELAADLAADHPGSDVEFIKTIISNLPNKIQARLIGGEQVTLKEAFTFTNSFTGRMDSPEDPLPEGDDVLQVRIYASAPFVRKVRQEARFEKLSAETKLPVISIAEDTHLKLPDVLMAGSILKLSGSKLAFPEDDPDCGCVIEGTRSGRAEQRMFGQISNSTVLLTPDIPAQDDPWNNEYVISISTQYTEHGTVRTGFYTRKLRTPLTVELPLGETAPGIFTGNADTPYARIIGCVTEAAERLRIAAALDVHTGILYFNLLDMQEHSWAGPAVAVAGNGEYTLSGFAGSAVTEMTVAVDNFAALVSLVRNGYAGRLVDILDVRLPD